MESPVGIFDSGIGGLAVMAAIRRELPEEPLLYYADNANLPYGTRTESEIQVLAGDAVATLKRRGCKLVVLACNSVSVAVIDRIRPAFPDLPIVGVVPMVKPAAEQTKSKAVAVFATKATLRSQYYADLKQRFAAGVSVRDVPGEGWAEAIESGTTEGELFSNPVREAVDRGADVLVLGCTHYVFAEPAIKQAAGGQVAVLQSGGAVARQVRRVLAAEQLLSQSGGGEQYLASNPGTGISEVASRLTGQKLLFEAE